MLYIMPIMPETTNIPITKQTYEELREIGIMGTIIISLLMN